jgi:hypothetical protein
VSIEAQAKELGHISQEAWVEKGGDPDKWRDADAFMEFGEKNVNHVKKVAEIDATERLEAQQTDFDERLRRQEKVSADALARQGKRDAEAHAVAIANLKSQRTAAAEQDDTKGVLLATEKLEELQQNTPVQEPLSKSEFESKLVPLILASPEVRKFSDTSAALIRRDNPGMSDGEFYTELQTQLTERFSDDADYARYFGKRPKPTSKVDTSGSGPSDGEGQGWDDLPPEAKKIGEGFITDGIFKNKADYAVSYYE